MKNYLTAVFLFIACHLSFGQTNDTLASLQAKLDKQVNSTRFAQAQWGIKVISEASGATIYQHNADKLTKPASNAKMYTASLALNRLGPDFRIKTSFYAAAKPDADGVVHGDLLVYGRGDPSFASRFNNDNYTKSLQPVVNALLAAGIKKIEGDLIGDESYFRGAPYGSEWTWDDLQNYYGAPVSSLIVEDDCIDLVFKPGKAVGEPCVIITKPATTIMNFINRTHTTAGGSAGHIDLYRPVGETNTYVWGDIAIDSPGITDSISVPNPALWFVSLLKSALAAHGVEVAGGLKSVNWLDREVNPLDLSKWTEIASVESRPLSEIIKNTLKPSQNQYAQLLLLQVGANSKRDGAGSEDTEAAGLAEMREFLSSIGIRHGMAWLQEGSGLSRGALVTPSASVQLLKFMAGNKYHAVFYDALPIAGVDGTLRNRFKDTPAEGNLHAKTGSLGGVDTLSGYLTTVGHDKLIFSIMLNNYSGHDGRSQVDAVVAPLVNFTGKLP